MAFAVTVAALKATIAALEAKYDQCKIVCIISCSSESDNGSSVGFCVLSVLERLQTVPTTAHARRDALWHAVHQPHEAH